MKTLLRALFVGFLFIMGIQLYSCASQGAYQKELVRQGNIAYSNGDFSLFKEIFEYYQEEPHIDESFILIDKDNRYDVTNKDIEFNLLVFLQSEKEKNHLTVIVNNLEIEKPDYSLRVVLKKDGGKTVLEEYLHRFSKNNWYIQYFEFDSEVIDQLLITHSGISSVEPIVLYDSLNDDNFKDYFLKKDEHNLSEAIKDNKLTENGIVKREKDPFAGKGTSVIIILVVYLLISLVIIYLMFFNKKQIKEENIKRTVVKEAVEHESKNGENK